MVSLERLCGRHRFTGQGEQSIPRIRGGTDWVRFGGCMGQQTLDCGLILPSTGRQIQTQDVENAEKWPELGSRNISLLKLADHCAELVTVLDGLSADESWKSQPIFEVDSVVCRTRAIQEVAEMFEQGICPALCHNRKAIGQGRE
jgi:hypothetical protein